MTNLLRALSMLESMVPHLGETTSIPSPNRWENLLLELLHIPSDTGKEEAVAHRLQLELRSLFPDATVRLQAVHERRCNVIMERGEPRLTLTTHIDTVPNGPSPRFTRDRIYGRGACDAKGQIIAQLWGLHEAISRGVKDYRCAFVVGEETDAIGAQAFLDIEPTEFILNGEPTENRFVTQGWGGVELEVTASGTSAHSSLGSSDSAIHKLITEVQRLLSQEIPGVMLNVGKIYGGIAANIQAPSASCHICARLREGPQLLLEALNKTFVECSWRAISPTNEGLSFFIPEAFRDSAVEVKFASDCSVYAKRYEKVMLFGPGTILEAHTADESIGRAELQAGAAHIADLVVELAGPSAAREPVSIRAR